jgi:serine/threonine protein phosphatase PrpC
VVFVQDARFYFDQEMVQGDVFDVAGGVAAVCTFRSPHKSTANEDSAGVMPLPGDAAVLAVADGMGGGAAGERASRTTLEVLHAALRGAAASELPLRSAILNGIESANQAVCDIGLGSGSTLAVAEIQNDTVRTYHVGDSMILVVGQRGKIKLQTVSHSPVGYAVEAGLLDEQEALHHEDRHIISNMIGAPNMRIEIGSVVRMAARDTLLLASDGLFDNLHVDEIVERVRKGHLDAAAQKLADDSRRRMMHAENGHPSKQDDLSFVAFRRVAHKRRK